MQKRILSIAITALLFSLFIFSCSKLDTTDIGSDVLPVVDNINTFETLLTINTTQGVFNLDSTLVNNTDDHVLGKISNDPLFGTTTASIFAQFKPTFFPYYYGNAKDTNTITGFDSVVLCLSYKGFWGDSLIPIQLQVKEIVNNAGNNGLWDSLYQTKNINYTPLPATIGSTIGSTTVTIANLANYVKYANGKDSVKNQIRIKLSPAFFNKLIILDTNYLGVNSPFRTDSLFRAYTNGLAISATGGNSLLYTNFTDSSSKLEIHYRKKNGSTIDTTFSAFKIFTTFGSSSIAPSATANSIVRNRTGYPVLISDTNEIYLQSTPGTYANLSIPSLDALSNRIIHRAEIIVEQIPDLSNQTFATPSFLYLDLKDTGLLPTTKWKPIYFDLNPSVGYNPDNALAFFPTNGIDFLYHGGYTRNKIDQLSNSQIKYYNFNITRYVQQIVTKHTTNYPLRLYSPYIIDYPQYYDVANFENGKRSSNNRLSFGRVKVGSGRNLNYKMRLRLVYSKI